MCVYLHVCYEDLPYLLNQTIYPAARQSNNSVNGEVWCRNTVCKNPLHIICVCVHVCYEDLPYLLNQTIYAAATQSNNSGEWGGVML